jgi:hypothetical protein
MHGASRRDIQFLVEDRHSGKRVELNAMTSPQLLDWLERRLGECGVSKVIPPAETLSAAWVRINQLLLANRTLGKISEENGPGAPANLAQRVEEILAAEPELSWDAAVRRVAVSVKNDGLDEADS